MTKTEIIAELRRSAAEDADPWYEMTCPAFWKAMEWYDGLPHGFHCEVDSTFFLFVAHATEDECAAT